MKTPSLSVSEIRPTGRQSSLRAKSLEDAERDYQWQTDAEMARLDATFPLGISFAGYLAEYRRTLRHGSPTRRMFAIENAGGEHIGNCGYYGINEDRAEAELGIMIGQRSHLDKGYGADAVNALLRYIFDHTALKRIFLKTLPENIRAQKCFLKCGFIPCGQKTIEERHFLLMEIDRNRWLSLTAPGKSHNL